MIRLVRIQEGYGRNRPLFVSFHIPPSDFRICLKQSGFERAFGISAITPAGGYGSPPGWDSILQQAADAGWPGGPVAFVGYAAGCAGLRELLRSGAQPDVLVALDGIHGPRGQVPALPATLAPWRSFAGLAQAGEALFVVTHTYQTYTESLSAAERFPATVNTVRAITGWSLLDGGPLDAPVQTSSGGLMVLSYSSKSMDKPVHVAQLSRGLPFVLSKHVGAWLGRDPSSGVLQEGMVG